MLHPAAHALRAELIALFHDAPPQLDDATFDRLARAAFAFQLQHNAAYAAYCARRGVTDGSVQSWTDIPPVPTAAFKEIDLVSGVAADVDVVFRTSGTTRGGEKRGRHLVPDASLYEASLLAGFSAFLLPDTNALPMLSLIPRAHEMPDSSLAFMTDRVLRAHALDGGTYAITVDGGLQLDVIETLLSDWEQDGAAGCILGTSFAFVHLLDALPTRGRRFELAPGSRLMDTGGFKGRAREVPEAELRASYAEWLGIPASHCINEYGMTELCSQYYDASLRAVSTGAAVPAGWKQTLPWLRTRAVDPESLQPVPDGTPGLLQHFDLANLGSVCAVLTEDFGIMDGADLRVLGRAPGATPRGCSIALDLQLDR